jgi:hypothetical protein
MGIGMFASAGRELGFGKTIGGLLPIWLETRACEE